MAAVPWLRVYVHCARPSFAPRGAVAALLTNMNGTHAAEVRVGDLRRGLMGDAAPWSRRSPRLEWELWANGLLSRHARLGQGGARLRLRADGVSNLSPRRVPPHAPLLV